MDRREFIAGIAAMPLVQIEPLLPIGSTQELVLPDDLAPALAYHCGLPLEERVVRADEAAKIAAEIESKSEAIFTYATDRDKFDYVIFSWINTGKRFKQRDIALQVAKAGEFTITKRNGLFVLQTDKCKLPTFRTSGRKLIVDYDDDDWWWPKLGGGLPACIWQNELHLHPRDWWILMTEVFGFGVNVDYFDDDILKGEVARLVADHLTEPDIESDPWPGLGYGWHEIADWLRQGECLFVAFPNQPMI
jgi:hypothetical protein